MRAAWYERQGRSRDVLRVGEMPDPVPGPGEVRIRIAASGVNPGDVKKRQDTFGYGMPYPRVIPHSDGAGTIDRTGPGVAADWLDRRVWCWGAQSYRPFGTAAELTVVPVERVVPLAPGVSFEQGACLGIPGITAHHALHAAGSPKGRSVLVQGGAGAVGQCAVALARRAGASVVATVRHDRDSETARRAGAHHVEVLRGDSADEAARRILAHAPGGIHHVVEVGFDQNVGVDERVLRAGGSISAYASRDPAPCIPFWPLVFKNVSVHFLGSDDFPAEAKRAAAADLNAALEGEWPGFEIGARLPLEAIAQAHDRVEEGRSPGRVIVSPQAGVLAREG